MIHVCPNDSLEGVQYKQQSVYCLLDFSRAHFRVLLLPEELPACDILSRYKVVIFFK